MKAMEMLEQYWEQLKRLFVYVQYCAGGDIQTPVCRDFWLWTAYAAIALGVVIAAIIARRLLREQLELYRNRKRLEARKIVADAETMEQAKWAGDGADDVDLSEEELAQRMREAMRVKAELETEVLADPRHGHEKPESQPDSYGRKPLNIRTQ